MKKIQYFQDFIYALCQYWIQQDCIMSQPYDQPMGAGTFHPHTFFKALGPEPWRSVYVQPCRRPVDGRYGKSPNRLQYYYQLQVLIKPTPPNILDVYLKSLQHIGIKLKQNDIALYEDNWKGPTLGAWGLGWEVRANGEEVTQFTYFQEFGGLPVEQTSCEITYGLERLFMYAHGYQNIMEIPYNNNFTYGDIFYQNEFEFSKFNFKFADTQMLFQEFELYEQKVSELCEKTLVLPAYDYVLKASHTFNLLDARGVLSVTARQKFLGKVRDCAKKCALLYCADRKEKMYPFLGKLDLNAGSIDEQLDSAVKPRNDNLKLRNDNLKLRNDSLKLRNDNSKPQNDNFKLHNSNTKPAVSVLLEIGVEEIPPDFQISAFKSLEHKIADGTMKFAEKYSYDEPFVKALAKMKINLMISSRRIAFICEHVPHNTPKQEIDLWGPAESIAKDSFGNFTPAGLGFCKKNQLDQNDVSYKHKISSGDVQTENASRFLYAQKIIPSSDFPTILVNTFKNYIYSLDIPIKMKWLPTEVAPAFIRPVRWILCLVNDQILPVEMFAIQSSSFTYGQRVLAPGRLHVRSALDYEHTLKKAHVVSCRKSRKNEILKQSAALLKKIGTHAVLCDDPQLLEKCVGMSESPYVFLGRFDDKYLKLPRKLITSVLKEHMNYFSILNRDSIHIENKSDERRGGDFISDKYNTLLPYYIGVANYRCLNIKTMIAGTQKVVTSRLEDGAFYFDNDLKIPFQSLREGLKTQVFQESCGTLFDKSQRLSAFAPAIAHLLNAKSPHRFSDTEIEYFVQAGMHCKNDLKTGCVQEFPDELQGVMGGILLRAQDPFQDLKKTECIAQAIEQHYFPEHAYAHLPSTKWGRVLALADKFDSLILLLSAGREPKGNHDPFGIRRLAIAIARLLNLKNEFDENESVCSFDDLLTTWQIHFPQETILNQNRITIFFIDRVKALLKEHFNTNNVEAVSNLITHKPLKIFFPLLTALEKHFVHAESLIAYKRARSLTHEMTETDVDPKLFNSDIECRLYSNIISTQKNATRLFENYHFDLFFEELSLVNQPLAEFFDSVLVNDPDLDVRQNRLQLLLKVRNLYENIIDLSVVQVTPHNEKL